jgi:hypothetical protein
MFTTHALVLTIPLRRFLSVGSKLERFLPILTTRAFRHLRLDNSFIVGTILHHRFVIFRKSIPLSLIQTVVHDLGILS